MTVLLDVIFLSVYRRLIAENYIGLLLLVITIRFCLLGTYAWVSTFKISYEFYWLVEQIYLSMKEVYRELCA
jgi:hypothetical protein